MKRPGGEAFFLSLIWFCKQNVHMLLKISAQTGARWLYGFWYTELFFRSGSLLWLLGRIIKPAHKVRAVVKLALNGMSIHKHELNTVCQVLRQHTWDKNKNGVIPGSSLISRGSPT